eukprot:jgi/Antlo1/954/1059
MSRHRRRRQECTRAERQKEQLEKKTSGNHMQNEANQDTGKSIAPAISQEEQQSSRERKDGAKDKDQILAKSHRETKEHIESPLEIRRKKVGPNIALIKKLQEERLRREEESRAAREREAIERKRIEELRREEALAREKEASKENERAVKPDEKLAKKIERMNLRGVVKNKERGPELAQDSTSMINQSLKSPICCILGHVDTGKTKILDKLRESDVQGGEVGGITQQIGATYFPVDVLNKKYKLRSTLPGLLVIDTPGHESFANLRSRGSSLCNLAVLVVDMFHLLEQQTLESIELLRMRKTPFVVALNKIDRLYGWKKSSQEVGDVTASQAESVRREFRDRVERVILKFAEIGLNARLYNENPDPRQFISLVPTSAITGEGLGNLVDLILKINESFMKKRNTYSGNFECVLLEVKVVEGFGATVDAILVDGHLNEGDQICVCSLDGPVITKVKSILMPQPLKEIRVKNPFKAVKSAKACLGLKIVASDLERAIPGSKIRKIEKCNEEEAKRTAQEELNMELGSIKIEDVGVHIQAPTLGSLEALASFLEKEKIPISGFGIGSVKKTDIIKTSTMKRYAMILCFDVSTDKDIQELAKSMNVKMVTAKIIYHLVDQYRAHIGDTIACEKAAHAREVVFPCALKIIPTCIFTKRSPLVLGVEVMQGSLKLGTPLFAKKTKIEKLGRVVSIEENKKSLNIASRGQKVAIKLELDEKESAKIYGRHFDENNVLYSMISRSSLDVLKLYFRDEVSKEDLRLIVEIKNILGIS